MSDQQIEGSALSSTQARALTDQLRGVLHQGHELLVAAWRGRAWEPLGYASWDDYCAGEFTGAGALRIDRDTRRQVVAELRGEGMSTRAIGSGIGSSEATVRRDLASSASDDAVDQLATVTSLDGRQRPATTPPRPTPPRRALVDVALDLSHELRKATERAERLAADDRFTRNRDELAARLRHQLAITVKVCQDLHDQLTD